MSPTRSARPNRSLFQPQPSRLLAVLSLVLLAAPAAAWAQGLLVDTRAGESVRLPRPVTPPRTVPPPASYKIDEIDVQARITDQVARVQVSQTFANTGSVPLEVCFMFPLPYDGAIDQLTLLIDGKEVPARLLGKEEARRIYESIVRKNRDPALLEWVGTGMFQTSVFPVPPGAQRKVSLRYTQLCRQDHGLTDFVFPLSTAKYTSQPVEKVAVQVTIESQHAIKNVYSPTHNVETERQAQRAVVRYHAQKQVPLSDFRLLYDVGAGQLGASVVSYRPGGKDDGYFLLLASPQIKSEASELPAKTVVFVLDRSGSMSGQKIEQAKGAAKFVLNNLRPGDLFNIVAYDSAVETFRPELQKYDETTRQAALGFVEGLFAGGSTDIDGALGAALGQLKDAQRPSYVLFLTDGLPTAGETNEMKIVAAARSRNQVRARIVSFGVGYDVNSRLLDKLTAENFGQSEYVRPNEDIEASVSRLFRRIQSPVMTDVNVEIAFDAAAQPGRKPVDRVYPKAAFDLFEGGQVVLVGRYHRGGAAKVSITGHLSGQPQRFDFPASFAEDSKDETFAFVEKLWAVRRIGEIIDELDLKGKNDELVRELVELSTRHGILTPYTSFLSDETTSLNALSSNTRQAEERVDLFLREHAAGEGGFSQRRAKQALKLADNLAAPHSAPAPGGAAGSGVAFQAADRDQAVVVDNLCQVGNKSFYRRAGRWLDSTLSEEQEKQAVRIRQFSPEFFELIARQPAGATQCFTFDEPVLVNLQGQAYLIEP